MEAGQLNDERVVNLFLAAMACPPERRESFVGAACADDDAVRIEVSRRVDWEIRMAGFLLTPALPRERLDRPFAEGETVLGRFRILRVAGEGGMGVVYEAFDEKLAARVALKCPRFEFRKRLSPEAQSSLRVAHRNVCRVFQIHTAETSAGEVDFLTMEFIDGETLAAALPSAPPKWLRSSAGAAIAQQLCAGLQAVHDRGVVHRDLKSGNIMLSADGRAVIMDFGIAQGAGFWSSQIRGTPDYLAPELWRGEAASARSDLYALGVLLHEMACGGRKPFAAETEWTERLRAEPTLTGIGGAERAAIRRCLLPDPAKRFGSAAEVAAALRSSTRRWIVIGGAASAAAAAAAAMTKERYWPGTPVRLALLPIASVGIDSADAPMLLEFVGDIGYRLRSVRRVQRPFVVLDPGDFASASADGRQDAARLGATHVLEASIRADLAVGELLDASSGKVIARAERAPEGAGGLADLLLAFQSDVVRMLVAHFQLRPESRPRNLSAAAFANYLKGLHHARFNYEDAALGIPFFERVIQDAPQSALGHAGFAEALLYAGDASGDRSRDGAALAAIARAEQLDPQSSHVHLIAGRFYARGGQPQRALAEMQLAVELDPQNAEAFIGMGYDLFHLDRPREAEAALQAAIRAQPGYYKPHLDIGMLHYELRDFKKAEGHWLEAARLAPSLTRARINLAAIYQRDGRIAEARKLAEEIAAIRRTSDSLELLGDLQPPAEAVATFEEALRIGPPSYTTWASLGAAYLALRREADAMGAFRSGLRFVEDRLRESPSEVEILAWCAYYHARLGETDLARGRAAEADSRKSRQGNVRMRLILTYGWIKDVQAAGRLLANAPTDLIKELRNFPDLPPALRADPRFAQPQQR